MLKFIKPWTFLYWMKIHEHMINNWGKSARRFQQKNRIDAIYCYQIELFLIFNESQFEFIYETWFFSRHIWVYNSHFKRLLSQSYLSIFSCLKHRVWSLSLLNWGANVVSWTQSGHEYLFAGITDETYNSLDF